MFHLKAGKIPVDSKALLLYFLFILLVPVSAVNGHTADDFTIVIVSNNGSDLDSCVNDETKGCKNLTFALEYLSKADPKFPLAALIVPGQYQLEAGILFKEIEQRITLAGDGGLANIVCNNESYESPWDQKSTGLAFVGSTNIDIINITLSGCGMEHDSTTVLNPSNETFVTFNVSLYFESCFNVQLTSVTVRDSIGVGIQFYATLGTVEIHDCTIANNPAYPDERYVGGGLLIEFPYCMPGNISSCGNIHTDFISNSHYSITDTIFEDNKAHNLSIEQKFVLPFGKNYDAFGYGGGLSVVFKGNASNNIFDIINCQWINNTAVLGGGLYVSVQDNGYNNSVALSSFNVFTGNRAIESGGGALFAYLFSPFTSDLVPSNNKFIINKTNFTENLADARGGGMFYLTPRQLPNGTADDLNQLIISDCIWEKNKGRLGSAIDLSIFHTDSEGTIHDVVFRNCSFISNMIVISQSTGRGSVIGAGAMYVDTVPVVFNESVTFWDNHFGTALVVSVSKVSFMPDTIAEFVNNAGMNGGAIALYSSAFIEISRNTSFLFEGNKARNRGGAIYAESFGTSLEKTSLECLIRYRDVTVVPNNWSTTFNFSHNIANLRNNSIYASTIKPCALLSGYADDINERLMNVFCWNEYDSIWEYNSNKSQNACMSQIQTDIASFDPDKSDRVIIVMPGKPAKLEIQPLNDQNSSVSEYIYHVYSQNENVTIDNDYYYVSDDTVLVYPTSNKTNVTGMIHVEAVQQNIVQFDLKVVFEDCHPGLTLKQRTPNSSYWQCTCSPYTKAGVFSCNNETYTAELLQGYWIGNYSNKTVYGHCISCKTANHTQQVPVHIKLNQTLDEFQWNHCSSQSGGVLCNQCNYSDGYAPAISYDKFKCVKCTHTVDPAGVSIFVICDVLLPLVYLIAVYIFDVPLTSGLFHGPILLCQLVSSIVLLDGGGIIAFNSLYNSSGADKLQRAYTGLYDSFNLYFARSLQETHCFSKHVTKFVTVIAINYVAALVPLLLVILSALVHYCSRTFCKCCMCLCGISCEPNCRSDRGCYKYIAKFYESRKNKANFLATAIMLSYTNVAVITSYLLSNVALTETETGKVKHVLYLDGTVDFLGKDHYHLPYFVFACVFGLTYLLIVPIFLFFYRPNDPVNNGGFLNHLLGQFQNEFRTKREIKPDQDGNYKEIINSEKVRLETWHLCTNTCFYYCKFRCTRYFNVYFITQFEPGNYQWFSGVLFLIRLLIVVPFIFAWNAFILLFFQFIICITYAIAVVLFHPYKRTQEDGVTPKKIDPNIIEASSMLLLSLLIALSLYQYAYTLADVPLSKWAFILQGILVWIPLVWIAIVYCRLFYLRNWPTLRQWFFKVYRCCRRRCVVGDRDDEETRSLVINSGHHQREDAGIHGSVNNRSTELSISHGSLITNPGDHSNRESNA